jgi:hypothetical protein
MMIQYDTKDITKPTIKKLNRLRYNGKKLYSVEDYFPIIINFLKNKPMGATELGYLLGKSREHVSRWLLRKMIAKNLIEKIPNTGKYQVMGHNHTSRSIYFSLLNKHDFYQCGTIKRWMKHATKTKSGHIDIATFKRLCMGEKTTEFRINPDTWLHPETTEECIDILLKLYGVGELSQGKRALIRHFLKYGLELNISTEEAKRLGIGGHKDSIGKYATVSFYDEQYNLAKSWMSDNHGLREQILFGVRFWTFCRPSTSYTIKLNQLNFYNRDIEYVQTSTKQIILAYYDKDQRIVVNNNVDLLSKNSLEIKRKTQRACYIPDLFEFKTKKAYPKYLLDHELVQKLEKYVKIRKNNNFQYLFWDENLKFDFYNYTKIVNRTMSIDNKIFKEMFAKIKCIGSIFETRANYALRHVGVQHWLEMTNYDFDLISEMGWEDINTLRQWYGRRSRKNFEMMMAQIMV